MTKKNLVIVGAGGLGLEVAGYAEDAMAAGAAFRIRGFLDDTKAVGTPHAGAKVIGAIDNYVPEDGDACVIAMGEPDHRRTVTHRLLRRGAQFTTLVHPRAYVASSAKLGEGCVISHQATVAAEAVLGAQVFLNVGALVGHEAVIGDFSCLSPYALMLGRAQLADSVYLGSATIITPGIKVGTRARISAGSVVYNMVPPGAIALGNPARFKTA
ncbi:MAG: acetyltransferase [Alphaproteobacteria bacterium]|nr:acetyltransferase [Alphaproteobacteria bacterium]